MTGPLDGLRIVDFSNTLIGTQMSQLLADFGADVAHVEPPGGSPLRAQPAWPFWGRGKLSIVLDLKLDADLDVAKSLARNADVLIETWRPGVAERLGLGYEEFVSTNPRLVYASVTGFGRGNAYSSVKSYEPIVLAKIGALDAFSGLSDRPGPSFVSTPYTSWSGGQLALQGILAALYERESSGLGQRLESTMLQGLLAHDTWNWLILAMIKKFSGAFSSAPPTDTKELVPNSPLFFRLMVGLSADGRWMQFSQTTDRLWEAFTRLTGLDAVLAEPEFKDAPSSEDPAVRVAFWEKALAAVRTRTYDQWLAAFAEEPDVWAEMYRSGTELLHHPQMLHDRQTLTLEDADVGAVLQPGPMVKMHGTPALVDRPAAPIDEHAEALRSEANPSPSAAPQADAPSHPPLEGVTVIELGTFYAAPFGATLLADLGARVIKIEQLDGDPMRTIMPFPEIGGIKVLQGKQSVAVDMTSDAGREIIHELVRGADAVLQTFRAGVAERHGYTAANMLAVNPDIIYLNAPGYGADGPMGHCPAFAPTMGAGSGLGYRNVGGPSNLPQGADLSLQDVKRHSMRLSMASMSVGHADGFSALGVGTALALGLLAKRRGGPGQSMMTSMLSTMAHALSEDMVEYAGRADMPVPDSQLLGFGARWRLYETKQGWVFLAAPDADDWTALARCFDLADDLASDDAKLAAVLEERFREKTAAQWEQDLTKLDVACAEVVKGPVEEVVMLDGKLGERLGIVTPQKHPVVEDYSRLVAPVRFSRSTGVAGPAPLCGAHTVAVLTELGYDAARIDKLRADGVIGGE